MPATGITRRQFVGATAAFAGVGRSPAMAQPREDPSRFHDLARDAENAGLVREWRARMVEHLAERGAPYVVDGDLGIRPKPMLYGPNFPRGTE